MTDHSWEMLSNQAVGAAGILYFLALIAHLVEWSALRPVAGRAVTAEPELAAAAAGRAASAGERVEATAAIQGQGSRHALAQRLGRLDRRVSRSGRRQPPWEPGASRRSSSSSISGGTTKRSSSPDSTGCSGSGV
jgi:hypothetical protein